MWHSECRRYPPSGLVKTHSARRTRADLAVSQLAKWVFAFVAEGRGDPHISGMNRDERPPRGRSRDERPPGSGQVTERHAARAPGSTEAALESDEAVHIAAEVKNFNPEEINCIAIGTIKDNSDKSEFSQLDKVNLAKYSLYSHYI